MHYDIFKIESLANPMQGVQYNRLKLVQKAPVY